MNRLEFSQLRLTGVDAQKFLQGQVTCHVGKLTQNSYQATAICDLKGRVDFGIWLIRQGEQDFNIVITADCAEDFVKHVKKYGAFSKIALSNPEPIFAVVANGEPTFSQASETNDADWANISIEQGNYWITQATRGLFQPQELRLHQRGGVDYDKGCYLGQEVIARLWFKASPKAWLHRISDTGELPKAGDKLGKIDVVNAIETANGFEALVVARPEELAAADCQVLALPNALQAPVARQV